MEPLGGAATQLASTALRVSYVGSFGYHGLLSVDPNDIPAQICSAAAGCQAGGVATSGTPATAANQSHVAQGAQYIPVGTRPNPYLGAGFFWYTEGNSSYNALQTDVSHRLSRGFANSRQLHLVEESGHEFGADRRAVAEPVADDSGPQRSAARLGTFRLERSLAGQHFGAL